MSRISSRIHRAARAAGLAFAEVAAGIRAVNVSIPSDPLLALPAFAAWCREGGPSRAGMGTTDFAQLDRGVTAVRHLAGVTHDELADVARIWSRLSQAESPAAARSHVARLLLELNELTSSCDALMSQATETSVEAERTVARVDAHHSETARTRARCESALNEVRRAHAEADRKYAEARRELSGEKGVLNGFLTGLTLSIYNPVKENLDKAKVARVKAMMAIQVEQVQLRILRQVDAELRGSRSAIQAIVGVGGAITELQNAANAAQTSMSSASDWLNRSERVSISELVERFRTTAGTHLHELFAWGVVLERAS